MSMQTHNQNDDELFPTVFTVPRNRAWVLSKEEAEIFLKDMPKPPATREEFEKRRAEAQKKAERWSKKPEKKKDE